MCDSKILVSLIVRLAGITSGAISAGTKYKPRFYVTVRKRRFGQGFYTCLSLCPRGRGVVSVTDTPSGQKSQTDSQTEIPLYRDPPQIETHPHTTIAPRRNINGFGQKRNYEQILTFCITMGLYEFFLMPKFIPSISPYPAEISCK